MRRIPESELILNKDGSIYHLKLLPGQVATTIITVGDPERVKAITKHFDSIEIEIKNREFYTVTGYHREKRLTVISTGIGTDNIDIVFNEIDALFNIDFETRQIKDQLTILEFIRIGTSGTFRPNIDVDSFLVSIAAVGLDGLMSAYSINYTQSESEILQQLPTNIASNFIPYCTNGNRDLIQLFDDFIKGITITCAGFYGPQGRTLRIQPRIVNFIETLSDSNTSDYNFTNFEMETAGIYGLSKLLGHKAVSISAILANRANGTFSTTPTETVEKLIEEVLDKIVSNQLSTKT